MARKSSGPSRTITRSKSAKSEVRASTPVRHTAIPKLPASVATRAPITHEQIAVRAYEIWQSGAGGSEFDNWMRAERELRGE